MRELDTAGADSYGGAAKLRLKESLGRGPISANLRLWDASLPRRGRRTQPGVLTPGAQPIKRLALKGPKVLF